MGVEGIGLSNYIAPHCELIIRLSQNDYELLQNILLAIVEKHRYGQAFVKIKLTALWDRSYVGDSIIPGTKGITIRKSNNQ